MRWLHSGNILVQRLDAIDIIILSLYKKNISFWSQFPSSYGCRLTVNPLHACLNVPRRNFCLKNTSVAREPKKKIEVSWFIYPFGSNHLASVGESQLCTQYTVHASAIVSHRVPCAYICPRSQVKKENIYPRSKGMLLGQAQPCHMLQWYFPSPGSTLPALHLLLHVHSATHIFV
jgi:hypothetical protein